MEPGQGRFHYLLIDSSNPLNDLDDIHARMYKENAAEIIGLHQPKLSGSQ